MGNSENDQPQFGTAATGAFAKSPVIREEFSIRRVEPFWVALFFSRTGVFRAVFNRILVVCIGNICRSPTAEYLFRQQLAERDIQVGSAGLGALVGRPMEATAMQLLKDHGIDAAGHVARQLEPRMLREADLVLVMERRHVAAVHRMAPEAGGKVFLLDKWLEGGDIKDPYRKPREAFERAYAQIERGVASWLRYL